MPLALSDLQLRILHHNQQALRYQKTHELAKATKELKSAIKLSPQTALLYHNLAGIYRELGNTQLALKNYKHALSITTTSITHSNLGSLYFELNRLDLALFHYLEAYKLDQKNIENSYLLGHVYTKVNQLESALHYYNLVYKANPHYKLVGACLFITKRKLCSWSGLSKISKILNLTNQEDPLGSLIRTEELSHNLLAAKLEAGKIQSQINDQVTKISEKYHHKKIHLGYISGNFSDHPVGYMSQTLYKLHDRNQFKIYTYAYGANDNSSYRKDIISLSDQFRDLNTLSDQQAAQQICKDEIDILIDLTGPTDGHRLGICAYHPAPIQITWAGLLGSTGCNFFDYTIVDEIVAPIHEQQYFTEKLLYLSPSYYLSRQYSPPNKLYTRSDFSLPEDQFVFACFNQMYKISPKIWKTWMKILNLVPNSTLWLWEQNKSAKIDLISAAEKLGVSSNRLIFSPTMSSQGYYDRLGLADLALDTPVYGGGATTYLSLMRSVPVLTLYGRHLASRLTSSILTQADLPELITHSTEEYLNKAVTLAQRPTELSLIRSKLTPSKLQQNLLDYKTRISELESIFTSLVNHSTM